MDCANVKDLCSFFAGDTLNYGFSVKKLDGSVIDISGMTLVFSVKLNKNDADRAVNNMQVSIVLPSDGDSQDGIGSMFVSGKDTSRLLNNRWYHFSFRLVNSGNGYVVGSGKVFVKQRVSIS